MDFGDEHDGSGNQQQRRRPMKYHRHTPSQIQLLEAAFRECPHPDENKRAALSRELGLKPRQIKFWFQNRRTQMKAHHERADNCFLRAENDKIRCENISMREALRNVFCPNCGRPPAPAEFFDEQKLRMENARLKQELEHVSSITAKYLGRPFTQMPPIPAVPVPTSALDLSAGGMPGLPVDFDLLGGASEMMCPSAGMAPFQTPPPPVVPEVDRPMMINTAARALDVLIRLAQAGDHVWVKGPAGDQREMLNLATYDSLFAKPGAGFRAPDTVVEGSRDSGIVFMSAVALVDVFIDTAKWVDFFPGIVSMADTVEILLNGSGGRNESMIMMYEELHLMTPAVPNRQLSFLRYGKQIEQGLWAVVDVSMDGHGQHSRRLPSGCLIADMGNGYSRVTWVEHMEIEHTLPINMEYRNLVLSGAAFGAHRWLATLQRACDRFASSAALGNPLHDPSGAPPEGKRCLMKLSHRMVRAFYAGLISSPAQRWTLISGANDVNVRVATLRGGEPGQPTGVFLWSATSFSLPVPGEHVFALVQDPNARCQWDGLLNGNPVQEVSCIITTGANPGNCITLLRGQDANQNHVLILQESFADASGSLVVYSPIDIPAANLIMVGEDQPIPLMPSGIAIVPDHGDPMGAGGASSSSAPPPPPAGCVVTVAFQMYVSGMPSHRINAELVDGASNLVNAAVQQIRAALNCAIAGPALRPS